LPIQASSLDGAPFGGKARLHVTLCSPGTENPMPLKFVAQPGTWDEHQETVHFLAFDGEKPVMCAVSLEALEDLAEKINLKPDQCVTTFQKHRKAIEQKAAALYDSGRVRADGVVLVKASRIL
jgi:hypothetical protein